MKPKKAPRWRAKFHEAGTLYFAVCFTKDELEWLQKKLTRKALRERVAQVLEIANGG